MRALLVANRAIAPPPGCRCTSGAKLLWCAASMAKRSSALESTPASQGIRMPAEWERHRATWLGWPHEVSDWPGKLPVIRWVYGEMIRKIATGEKVCLCVNSKADEKMARH